jgi:1,4-dihydroxy-2-naphthoate octaprenyltransferase
VALGPDLVLLIIFLAMGVFALFAAIGYTVGKRAYGYYGLGDIFCLACFGWLAVCGGFFLYAHSFTLAVALAGTGVGLLVVGVLNLNNMRDRATDAATGKRTLVVRIGARAARIYHCFLLVGGLLLLAAAAVLIYIPQSSAAQPFAVHPYGIARLLVFLLSALPLALVLKGTSAVRGPKGYDRWMRPLSMSIILQSLAFAALAAL